MRKLTVDDIVEAGNRFEGLRTKGWRSQLWNPVRWPLMVNPLVPSWGEAYADIASSVGYVLVDKEVTSLYAGVGLIFAILASVGIVSLGARWP